MQREGYKPPTSANELLERYAAGERKFPDTRLPPGSLQSAVLEGVDLSGAVLASVNLSGAKLKGANLRDVNFLQVNLSGADLSNSQLFNAHLLGANLSLASFTGADLTDADLARANLLGADLEGGNFANVRLGHTVLIDVNLESLCEASPPPRQMAPSGVDYRSILRSLCCPNLGEFLQRAGLPEVFVEYMIDCARAIDGSLINKLLQSTFISYGGPDEPFARRLYEALHRNGVTTFFFPEHAKPGQRIGRVVRENVESYDRILLLCSKMSLDRPGVLYEIEETLERERRAGGADYLVPVMLDDHLLSGWKPERPDVARALQGRVVADFRNADRDEEKFNAGLRKLIGALRQPDVATWRPVRYSKPTEP